MKTYIVTICAIFGGVESTQCFIDKAKAEEFVLNWANQNRPDWDADTSEHFANATEVLEWFKNNSEKVDYAIQLFESELDITAREHLAEINSIATNSGIASSSQMVGLVLYKPADYSTKDKLLNFNGVDVGDDNYYIDTDGYLEDKDNGNDKPLLELVNKCADYGITMINVY